MTVPQAIRRTFVWADDYTQLGATPEMQRVIERLGLWVVWAQRPIHSIHSNPVRAFEVFDRSGLKGPAWESNVLTAGFGYFAAGDPDDPALQRYWPQQGACEIELLSMNRNPGHVVELLSNELGEYFGPQLIEKMNREGYDLGGALERLAIERLYCEQVRER